MKEWCTLVPRVLYTGTYVCTCIMHNDFTVIGKFLRKHVLLFLFSSFLFIYSVVCYLQIGLKVMLILRNRDCVYPS